MEIIPNWHPVAVHFPIALLSSAVVLMIASSFAGGRDIGPVLLLVARCNLWLGTVALVWALVSGWLAYNSVDHDAISHQAMTVHYQWAIPTSLIFLVSAIVVWFGRRSPVIGKVVLFITFIGLIGLARTGYLGAENVYRHGLGVISTPAMRASEAANSGHNNKDPVGGESVATDSGAGQGHSAPHEH